MMVRSLFMNLIVCSNACDLACSSQLNLALSVCLLCIHSTLMFVKLFGQGLETTLTMDESMVDEMEVSAQASLDKQGLEAVTGDKGPLNMSRFPQVPGLQGKGLGVAQASGFGFDSKMMGEIHDKKLKEDAEKKRMADEEQKKTNDLENKKQLEEEKQRKKEDAEQKKLAKLKAMTPRDKARLLAAKVLKSGSQSRETAQELSVMDADDKLQKALRAYSTNCETNHGVLSALIDEEVDDEDAYADVVEAVSSGFTWYQKKCRWPRP